MLTSKQEQIVKLICQGFSNKEIADKLEVGKRTIETHRERIYKKLKINCVAKLVVWAIKTRLFIIE